MAAGAGRNPAAELDAAHFLTEQYGGERLMTGLPPWLRAEGSPLTAPLRFLSNWSVAAVLGVLALLAALPYANTLFNAFVYDDNTQVLNNPYIQNFGHLREIFTTTVWSYVGVQGVTNYYRPMMTLGYLLCHQLFGPLAYGFHLVNVLLHAGVTCALFLLTVRLFGHRGLAFVAAGLFALHPVHTESVAWVAAVTDLELTFFYLLTFWFFLGVARPGAGVPRAWSWPWWGALSSPCFPRSRR